MIQVKEQKLLLCDRDGTLITSNKPHGFINSVQDIEVLPMAAERLRQWHKAGWQVAIVSNQGGVAAGHKTHDAVVAEMTWCMNEFPELAGCYWCEDLDPPQSLAWLKRWFGLYPTRGHCLDALGNVKSYPEWYVDELVDNLPAYDARYRKPGAGLLLLALLNHACLAYPYKVVVVGDRPEDSLAARKIGAVFLTADAFRDGIADSIRDQVIE